jgi:hypothetical protein
MFRLVPLLLLLVHARQYLQAYETITNKDGTPF